MRNINNLNTKGITNVKSSSEEKIFSSKDADVIRDESKWDAFQLVGDTNREEATHQPTLQKEKSDKEMQKILDRALAFRMGRKIAMVLNSESA